MRYLNLEVSQIKAAEPTPGTDQWNYWIFDLYTGGEIEKETSQEKYEFSSSFEARRITEDWKFENGKAIQKTKRL